MVVCLTGARFNMDAEVLRWEGVISSPGDEVGTGGTWETYQDPITGEILNRWVPGTVDNTSTSQNEYSAVRTIKCMARGIVDGGIRVAGTTERFGDTYENIDFVKMWTPASIRLSKRDRITNIRERKGGRVVWIDEEYSDDRPTVFNVNGVTPLFDAFNRHVENFVLLEKTTSTEVS